MRSRPQIHAWGAAGPRPSDTSSRHSSGTWPAATSAGLLGPSFPAGSQTFVQMSQLSGVQQIAASGSEACALLNDGSVECWGSSGTGAAVPPTRVTGLL